MQVNFNFSVNIDDRIISFFKRIFIMHKIFFVFMIALITVTLNASVPFSFTAGTTIIASDVNSNFEALDTRITALEGGVSIKILTGTLSPTGFSSTIGFPSGWSATDKIAILSYGYDTSSDDWMFYFSQNDGSTNYARIASSGIVIGHSSTQQGKSYRVVIAKFE